MSKIKDAINIAESGSEISTIFNRYGAENAALACKYRMFLNEGLQAEDAEKALEEYVENYPVHFQETQERFIRDFS